MAKRFHIAEWYGHPFHQMDEHQRVKFAQHKVGGAVLSKMELNRLAILESKAIQGSLTEKESDRLSDLRAKLDRQNTHELPCPFRTDKKYPTCVKQGGVCSIRVYSDEEGHIAPIDGKRGRPRALCPWRFHQNDTIFQEIGARLLGDPNPIKVREVGFLESSGNLDSEPGKDVGRIDMILVKSNGSVEAPMEWVAVEVQAVYFSGRKMSVEFEHLINKTNGRLTLPKHNRRPDYRSSGVKRLLPQLQIKVPTLSRWAKKMAVIVDISFFESISSGMKRENDLSNADIVWIPVDFIEEQNGGPIKLKVVDEYYTKLEDATLGLTGGTQVAQSVFEDRIKEKMDSGR